MKTLKFALLIAVLIPCQLNARNADAPARACFLAAKEQLENMLSGKEKMSYEEAIYQVENAWWEGGVDRASYTEVLDHHTSNIKKLIAAYKSDGKTDPENDLSGTKEQKRKNYQNALVNFAIYKYLTTPSLWIENGKITCHKPYSYSKQDPMGTADWRNTQVIHLMNENRGNCFALASLFRIFSERLHSDATLCTAPSHIYIRHADDKGIYYNVELSNRSFPGTGTIETLTYTPGEATKNNISLRELDPEQSIALCFVYLAKGYEYKFNIKNDDFILSCAESALRYDDHNLNAMLLKAEVLENRITAQKKDISALQKQADFQDYEQWVMHIFKLGYREMPFEMKNLLIKGWTQDTIMQLAAQQHIPERTNNRNITPTRYASLSWGLFDEEIRTKQLERFGNTVFDTKKHKIVAFLKGDVLYNQYNFDPVVFALSIDPLTHKFPSQSPYTSFGNSPIYNIDVDGAFQYPAKEAAGYAKNYPMLTKYLAQNVQRDVMKSTIITQAMSKYSEGNLTRSQIQNDTKWGEKSSPTIVFNKDLNVNEDGTGYYGRYDNSTNTINISKGFADKVEGILAGNGSDQDKQAALYEFFGTLTHEEVHRGDYLDGSRQQDTDPSGWGGEPGTAFMADVFESKNVEVDGKQVRVQTGASIHGDSKQLVEDKKASGEGSVVPTVPSK